MVNLMHANIYVGNSESGGISAFRLEYGIGELKPLAEYQTGLGLSPLAVGPDRRVLYAASRSPDTVHAFAIDSDDGALHLMNSVPAPAPFIQMTVDRMGGFLLAASYGGNIVAAMPLGKGGMPQREPACVCQPGRNPHCIVLDASNRFAYVPVLGNDCVAGYCFNAATGELRPLSPPVVATGRESGPRHLLFSPDGRFAYVLCELSGEIARFAHDRENGGLVLVDAVPFLPPDRALPRGGYAPPLNRTGGGNSPVPVMWGADIHISPDGRWLYASERTNSTLSVFAVDSASGRLDLTGCVETEKQPRAFAVDGLGRNLFVVGEMSNHLAMYAVQQSDGGLVLKQRFETGGKPNWIEIVECW